MLEVLRKARKRVLPLAVASVGFATAALADMAESPTLAIANFDFRDTSGEVPDKSAVHKARLEALNATLRNGLSESTKVSLVTLDCQAGNCTARGSGLQSLSESAKKAGARYLLFGEVHKMSTLVGWVKFAMLDLQENKPTCDQFLTYRGDTDEAWRRAAEFTIRSVEKHCIP